MIDTVKNRVAYLKVKGVALVAKEDIVVTDLVQRQADQSDDITVDDLVNRETTATYGGVTVRELIERNYSEIIAPSQLYTNIFTVNIPITKSVPIVRVDNKDGISIDPSRDVATHDEPVTTPDNELYDPDMDDRFTLIASPKSLYTGNLLYVYHDKKYEDIFAIPDLTNICNKDSYDNLIGMELKMYGTAIGLHYRKMIEDKEVPDNTNPVNFKDTPSPVTATTHLRNSIVSDMMYPIHDADLKVDNVEIAKSRRIIPIQYISLGDASAISNSKPIPVFHVLSHNTTSEHLMYNSHYIPPEFIFPLQF